MEKIASAKDESFREYVITASPLKVLFTVCGSLALYAGTVILSLVVAGALIPFAAPFLRLLKTPAELIEVGVGYFRVEILSLVLSFFNTVYVAIERSRGHARKILNLNLAVVVIKLGLSAVFVYVFQWGVIMISVASLISHGALTAYVLLTMPGDEGAFRFTFSAIRFDGKTVAPGNTAAPRRFSGVSWRSTLESV